MSFPCWWLEIFCHVNWTNVSGNSRDAQRRDVLANILWCAYPPRTAGSYKACLGAVSPSLNLCSARDPLPLHIPGGLSPPWSMPEPKSRCQLVKQMPETELHTKELSRNKSVWSQLCLPKLSVILIPGGRTNMLLLPIFCSTQPGTEKLQRSFPEETLLCRSILLIATHQYHGDSTGLNVTWRTWHPLMWQCGIVTSMWPLWW